MGNILIETKEEFLRSLVMERGLNHVVRWKLYQEQTSFVEAYSNFWMLCRYDIPDGGVYISRNGKRIALKGDVGVYIPPFSMVEWHFDPGLYRWEFYSCHLPVDKRFPQEPLGFPWNPAWKISTYDDLGNILIGLNRHICLQKKEFSSYVAERTKAFLDSNFNVDLAVSEISRELKIPHSTMTHSFTSCYGITPVFYRKTLRTFEALRMITEGRDLLSSCFDSGFNSVSAFNKSFYEILNQPPSHFKTR